MQNQTIFELYTDDNKSKYASNPKDIVKSGNKKLMKNSTPSELPQLLLLNLFGKFLIERKYLMNTINSETNYKPPGNDGLTAEFYKHFSNEPVPVLLDVYDYWRKLSTICFTSRRGISINFL